MTEMELTMKAAGRSRAQYARQQIWQLPNKLIRALRWILAWVSPQLTVCLPGSTGEVFRIWTGRLWVTRERAMRLCWIAGMAEQKPLAMVWRPGFGSGARGTHARSLPNIVCFWLRPGQQRRRCSIRSINAFDVWSCSSSKCVCVMHAPIPSKTPYVRTRVWCVSVYYMHHAGPMWIALQGSTKQLAGIRGRVRTNSARNRFNSRQCCRYHNNACIAYISYNTVQQISN